MVEFTLEQIIEFRIPENLRGKTFPETNILIPKEAIGLYVDCPLGLDENSDDSIAEIVFCGENKFEQYYSYEEPFYKFMNLAEKYLIKNP